MYLEGIVYLTEQFDFIFSQLAPGKDTFPGPFLGYKPNFLRCRFDNGPTVIFFRTRAKKFIIRTA